MTRLPDDGNFTPQDRVGYTSLSSYVFGFRYFTTRAIILTRNQDSDPDWKV
jgi:hypothetical protein